MESGTHITLKGKALEKITEYFARDGHERDMLRISLVRTHCMQGQGHTYSFAPERDLTEEDEAQDVDGLRVVLRKDQISLLEGTVVDYAEGLEGSGFTITNPQASGKCPCGHHDLFG
ncbi:MAG: HesB/IscA family protein [Thermoplasmata archaeon]